jgi:t-SNARE complex subunit (syntaxin)
MIKSSGAQQQKTFAEETLNNLISKIQNDVAIHLKKEINEISNLHNEIMLIEYTESDFKQQHYYKFKKSKKNFLEKLQSIKDSINYLSETDVNTNKLQKRKQDCIDQTIEFINKYEETTLEKINEIDKKTKKWQENLDKNISKNDNNNNDMSESLLPPEDNEEVNQYKLQATALLNRNEFLNERDKEIRGIHKISGMINGLSEEMKKNVYEGGIKLNSIEEHVDHTVQNTDKAEEEIKKAKKIEAGNRKKLCCILWIAIFVVLAVIALIYIIIRNMS